VTRRAAALVLLLAALAPAARAEDPAAPSAAAEDAAAPRVEDAQPAGPSVEERLEEIRRRLQAAVEYPPIARRMEFEGTTWLRFELDRAGVAHSREVSRSAGHDVLDRAALRTLERVGPLPWVYGRIEVPIRFALDDPPP
jgi:protein TonB